MPLSLDSTNLGLIALAIGVSYFLTAVAKVVARRTGMMDNPDGRRKAQREPMPLLGGVAVYLALVAGIAASRWFGRGEAFFTDAGMPSLTTMLLLSGGLFCGIGMWDDRTGLRPRTKFLLQIAASIPFVVWGRSVMSIELFGTNIELGIVGYLFTAFWLVACSNIINLVDGLDGLAGTIGMIVCVAVAALAEMQGTPETMLLALLFAGGLFGFLLHNWPPASIYLGDSGSLTIGFVIGALSIESSMKKATGFALAIPLVLVSVPVFDTFMAIVRRKLNGKGIGEADRGHIHHRLQDRGLSRAQSLMAISALCVVMAAVTIVSAYFQNDRLALSLCVSLLAMLIVGRVFGYDETVLFFRYTRAMSTLLAGTSGVLRTQLMVDRISRKGVEPIHSWKEITEHVEMMGGVQLEFVCWHEADDDVICRLRWAAEREPEEAEPAWQFSYSVPGQRGLRATLKSHGRLHARIKKQRFVDLFTLFDTFCQSWTLAPIMSEASEAAVRVPARAGRTKRDIEPAIIPAAVFERERRAA